MSAWDAQITRVDQAEPGLLSLSLRTEGRNEVLVLTLLPGSLGLGVVDKRPRGASASPAISQLRRHLEGARIETVEMSRRAARLSLSRGGWRRFLTVAPRRPYGAWWLLEEDDSPVLRSPGAPSTAPAETEHYHLQSPEALRHHGDAALAAHQSARRAQLERVLNKQIRRIARKRQAVLGDLERAAGAEDLHEKASLLLAHLTEIPPAATYFETKSWDEEARPIRIELDPRRSPADLAQDLFRKSKRLKRGLELAQVRLRAVDAELEKLVGARARMTEGSPSELARSLETWGVPVLAPKEAVRKRRQAGERLPYREFVSNDGSAIWVGRNAADNDRLTLRYARPHDLWLHAREATGAHVLVRLVKGQTCSSEALVDAATLAAHFSDLRGEAVVDVLYTPRRFVRKRKGTAAGSVRLDKEKVIALRLEPTRLESLLQGEKKAP